MPREELCHICYRRRLAMMQTSQYSIYDEYYKEELERVYKTCGGSGPTEIPPPLKEEVEEPAFCLTSKHYTTKEGDTCDSISKASGVSGALLYIGNQEAIVDCRKVPVGLRLCLPMTCKTYYVQPDDTCFSIETSQGIRWDDVQFYNSWVNRGCTNLQTGTDFYGKSICISPLGEETSAATKASNIQRTMSRGNGPTFVRIAPPEDAEVAEDTTLNCGKWHVVTESDTCGGICKENGICKDNLIYEINPSLGKEKCTESLVPGVALCVAPISGWNVTYESTGDAPA
ncbi:hypothetical protein ACHAPT_009944 [Fusarium lateritium]